MGLGDKTAASAFVGKGIAVVPIEKDALNGPVPIEILARVSTQMGEPDGAIGALQKSALGTLRERVCHKRAAHSRACFGSIRGSIRSAAIRASRNSPLRNRRKQVANETTW
jgi:hypothetical protein